ncbi:MAG: hypothetical protein QOC87_98, partial [Actinomycetota bacterium]|nr:hypothetical protein [Actinomycetota bacterium]
MVEGPPQSLVHPPGPEYQPDWGANTSDPSGPGGCTSDCGGPSTIKRSITLKLGGHLSASGVVATKG